MGRMKTNKGGRIVTSVTISPEFYHLCYEHGISFSDALRVGISIKLAELGLRDYDNNLNIYRKMTLFKQKAEEALAKIYELEEKIKTKQSQSRNL